MLPSPLTRGHRISGGPGGSSRSLVLALVLAGSCPAVPLLEQLQLTVTHLLDPAAPAPRLGPAAEVQSKGSFGDLLLRSQLLGTREEALRYLETLPSELEHIDWRIFERMAHDPGPTAYDLVMQLFLAVAKRHGIAMDAVWPHLKALYLAVPGMRRTYGAGGNMPRMPVLQIDNVKLLLEHVPDQEVVKVLRELRSLGTAFHESARDYQRHVEVHSGAELLRGLKARGAHPSLLGFVADYLAEAHSWGGSGIMGIHSLSEVLAELEVSTWVDFLGRNDVWIQLARHGDQDSYAPKVAGILAKLFAVEPRARAEAAAGRMLRKLGYLCRDHEVWRLHGAKAPPETGRLDSLTRQEDGRPLWNTSLIDGTSQLTISELHDMTVGIPAGSLALLAEDLMPYLDVVVHLERLDLPGLLTRWKQRGVPEPDLARVQAAAARRKSRQEALVEEWGKESGKRFFTNREGRAQAYAARYVRIHYPNLDGAAIEGHHRVGPAKQLTVEERAKYRVDIERYERGGWHRVGRLVVRIIQWDDPTESWAEIVDHRPSRSLWDWVAGHGQGDG